MLGDSAGGRVGTSVVDIFAVDVLGASGEGAAVLATGVALLEAVELDFWDNVNLKIPGGVVVG